MHRTVGCSGRMLTAMLANGFTADQVPALAAKAGVSEQAVQSLLDDNFFAVDALSFRQIYITLGFSACWLTTGEGSPLPKVELDPDEAELLDHFRKAHAAGRRRILQAARRYSPK